MIRSCRRFRVLQCDKCWYWGCFRFQWGVGNDTGPKERTCCWGWMQSRLFWLTDCYRCRSVEFKSRHRNGEMIYKKLQAFVLFISNLCTIHCIFIVGAEHWSQHGSSYGPDKSGGAHILLGIARRFLSTSAPRESQTLSWMVVVVLRAFVRKISTAEIHHDTSAFGIYRPNFARHEKKTDEHIAVLFPR